MVNQSGAIYWYQCGDLGCDDEYIGETSRTFDERYKEYLKPPSAIHHHSSQTGLNNNIGKFNLPHRWDRVLLNTKSLNLKRQVNNNNTQPN